MCGRFTIANPDPGQIAQQFELPSVPTLEPRYNVAPTQSVAVIFNDAEGKNHLDYMFWGLIPSWSKDASSASKMINARAETVAEKPAFRSAMSKRRCLIVADGFYEWKTEDAGSKQPMRITLKDGEFFGFAGLYERWTEPNSGEMIPTCTIITTMPNSLMAPIHNRMPVIIPRDQYKTWLDYKTTDATKVLPLLAPYDAEKMRAYPVSRAVNNPKANGADLIQSV